MSKYNELISFLRTHNKLDLLIHRRGVRVVQNYNLRWPKEPVPDTYDWTVFINKRGNLAHAILFDVPEAMVRLPGLNLKGCTEGYAVKELLEILEKI